MSALPSLFNKSTSSPPGDKRLFDRCEVDIGNYETLDYISRGGFGSVYKIKRGQKIYVAKIIECGGNQDLVNEAIEREVKIMLTTYHKTLINFIGFSRYDINNLPNITIIMEYAENGSLRNILEQKPKRYNNTVRQIIITGIARGMKYIHDHYIIHRDLKPENVLIDENYHPLISDFGLSKCFDNDKSKKQSKFHGTLYYMAPELLLDNPYGRKVDVYAFSLILYEVVTGTSPFKGKKDFVFANSIVSNHRPSFNVPIKKKLKEMIEKCWSQEQEERPTFKEIFEKLSSDDDYLLEGVNKELFQKYVHDITEDLDPVDKLMIKNENYQKEIEQLKAENERIKSMNFTDKYNSLPLLKQKNITDDMVKLNQLFDYLIQFDVTKNMKCIEIQNNDKMELQVHILPDATEILYKKDLFKLSDFVSLLSSFNDLYIEIKYSSNSFIKICSTIKNLKQRHELNEKQKIVIYSKKKNRTSKF